MYENEQKINKIKNYDIILMKDKNLNILSPRTSNPLLYIIYNFISFITGIVVPSFSFGQLISETFIVSTSFTIFEM